MITLSQRFKYNKQVLSMYKAIKIYKLMLKETKNKFNILKTCFSVCLRCIQNIVKYFIY